MMGFTEKHLDGVPFDFAKRPEQLSPADFVQLSGLLEPYSESLSMKF
jgi:hypothetical protein